MDKIKYLIIFLLVAAAGAGGFFWTKNRMVGSNANIKRETTSVPTSAPTSQPVPNYPQTVGNFLVTDKEVCTKDGKTLVYFFGSTSCPHCVWEKPIMEKVAKKFGDTIDFHENIDSSTDSDVFQKYSDINPGYVPFLVLGCKYVRVGAGENLGADDTESQKLEEEALTAILCKLTGSKPDSVCASVKDKTSGVK